MNETRADVLHYIGADHDRGGIVSVIRGLADADRFDCRLGVNHGAVQRRTPPLPVVEFAPLEGERLSVRTFWRARAVAGVVRGWLAADARRIFHGHSRAGLAVAWWLRSSGERRVVVSVHCSGRQRWFYRLAAKRLGDRLYWLSPAMKRYYGITDAGTWEQCVSGCIALGKEAPDRRREARPPIVRLGGVGMLVAWKRWHVVLDALAQLPAQVRTRIRFAHIGAADDSEASRRYEANLRAQTAALALGDIVEWCGEQPGSDAFWRDVDCLVVASRREPLSVAMLEALRAGVPVLAARSGGNSDVVSPPRNGWFFEPDDARDLARTMVMLVETDALQRAVVLPADLKRFEARTVAAQWAAIYARL